MAPVLAGYASLHAKVAPSTRLVLSEFASAADGGCVNMSNTFAAGFFFVDMIGRVAEAGFWQAYRQDLVGFSGIGFGSSYALAGDPGWFSLAASGPLEPNPDYFTALLWRTLVGSVLFSVDVGVEVGGNAERAGRSVWWARLRGLPHGCCASTQAARRRRAAHEPLAPAPAH